MKVLSSSSLHGSYPISIRSQEKPPDPPGDRFQASSPTEPLLPKPQSGTSGPGKVSWFHRATAAATGWLAGWMVGGMMVGGGILGASIGAGAGLLAGALAAGIAHTTEKGTALLHRVTAGVAGLAGGAAVGMEIGDVFFRSAGGGELVLGTLVGGAIGAVGLAAAAKLFKDR